MFKLKFPFSTAFLVLLLMFLAISMPPRPAETLLSSVSFAPVVLSMRTDEKYCILSQWDFRVNWKNSFLILVCFYCIKTLGCSGKIFFFTLIEGFLKRKYSISEYCTLKKRVSFLLWRSCNRKSSYDLVKSKIGVVSETIISMECKSARIRTFPFFSDSAYDSVKALFLESDTEAEDPSNTKLNFNGRPVKSVSRVSENCAGGRWLKPWLIQHSGFR